MTPTWKEIALEAVQHRLAGQEATLDDVRSRSGLLVTANSIVVAFLGAAVLDRPQAFDHAITWVGLTMFVAATLLVPYMLWPREWEFALSRDDIERLARSPKAFQEALADELTDYFTRNSTKLERLMWGLIAAAVLVPAQALIWVICLRVVPAT